MLRTGAESTGFCCKGFEWKSDTDSAILNRKHVTGEMVLFLNPSHFKSNYKMDVSSAALWRSTEVSLPATFTVKYKPGLCSFRVLLLVFCMNEENVNIN